MTIDENRNLLRVVRGRVLEGQTSAFLAVCRAQVQTGGNVAGLMSFMGGYRRVGGEDEYLLVSTWESEVVASAVTGSDDRPAAAVNLRDVATVDSIERYELHPPLSSGFLDAPGAVVRVGQATLKPGKRDEFFRWMKQKDREIKATRLLLGWALGERTVEKEHGPEREMIAVTAWPSPLAIEAMAEPGRAGMALFAAVEEFVVDIQVSQYQSIELDLPERLAVLGGRRVVAARFDSESAANTARDALSTSSDSANEAGISVARLASDEGATQHGVDRHVLVARVSLSDYATAERMIADHGGQIILAADERIDASP